MKSLFLTLVLILAALVSSSFVPVLFGITFLNIFLVAFLYFVLLMRDWRFLIFGIVLVSFLISFGEGDFFVNLSILVILMFAIKVAESRVFTKLNFAIVGSLGFMEVLIVFFLPFIFSLVLAIRNPADIRPLVFDVQMLYEMFFVGGLSALIFYVFGNKLNKKENLFYERV